MQKFTAFLHPKNQEPWGQRFNRKIDRNISTYKNCGIKIPDDDKILNYIEQNRHLLNGRPQCFQHGDYHAGNMIISQSGELGIIDFNSLDYGDPWEEFNGIRWCERVSKHFASGRIDGYFGCSSTDGRLGGSVHDRCFGSTIPNEFFRLIALYISSNQLTSVPWAISVGQVELNTMLKQANDMLDYYEGMTNVVPKWYVGGMV